MEKRLESVEKILENNEAVLSVAQVGTKRLSERVIKLERQLLNTSQYIRNRQLVIHNVSEDVTDLPKHACDLFKLTGVEVSSAALDKCHRLPK